VSDDDGKRIISVADARATIREAAGRNVPCSFMIMVDPEMRPRKLIALWSGAPTIRRMSSATWTNADLGPTVH
jgi:hypothetical protein